MGTNNKEEIRKMIKKNLREQKREDRDRKSTLIGEKLSGLSEFKRAKTVMFYVSLDEEVNTENMIDETLLMGKQVVVPVIKEGKIIASPITDRKKDLVRGSFGIYEPLKENARSIQPDRIDLVIVPGVAFDLLGNRLGRGKGYYDRFLAGLIPETCTVGLAFDFQVVEDLPRTPHDIPVKKLLVA